MVCIKQIAPLRAYFFLTYHSKVLQDSLSLQCENASEYISTDKSSFIYNKTHLLFVMKLKLFAILAMTGLASVQAQDITISSNDDWKAFIGSTSANASANVKLAADITIDDYFRGTFSGTIDGQGHTITLPGNLTQDFAPIGTAGAGATFKNLNIVGDVTTNKQLSGIAWKVSGATTIDHVNVNLKVNSSTNRTGGYIVNCDGKTTFTNCTSTIDFTTTAESNAAGFICAVNTNGSFRFENCVVEGKNVVNNGWRAGGFVGSDYVNVGEATFINCVNNCDILQWNGSERIGGFVGSPHANRSYVFTNCLQTGLVKRWISNDNHTEINSDNCLILGCNQWNPWKYTTTNCYYTTRTAFPAGTDARKFARMDQSTVASGAMCYALNGDQSQINFYQTLGEDAAPVLDSTHKQVFASGRKHCDGSDYADLTYNNVSGETTTDEHNFVDNVCDYCQEIVISADGYFHIVNAAGWDALVNKHKTGATNINVKLETDLTITQMLASNYCGTFDGQGHTINATVDAGGTEGGIFGIVMGGTYKNVVATGTVRNASQAGFIGMLRAGDATFENVVVNMDIEGTANVAGLVGCFDSCDGKSISFKNVLFAGKAKYVGAANGNGTGGFLAWSGTGATYNLENCAMVADIDQSGKPQKSAIFIRANNGCKFNMTNCAYIPAPNVMYVNGHSSEANANATIVENATDGRLCYLLNGDQTKINFYQTLDEDNIPTINTTHKQVYANGRKHCDGSDYAGMTYNNVSGETTTDEHNYVDNVCDYCHNLCIAADGYFHVVSKAGWDEFYTKQRAGITNINVKLETDLTVSDPVRNTYSGTLDGQGHTITAAINLPDWDGVGIFQVTGNCTIKNLRVDGEIYGKSNTGAFVGQVSGKTNFQNVVSSANVIGLSNIGGFAGNTVGSQMTWQDCLWDGKVRVTEQGAGGYVGWSSDNTMTARNCVAVGEVEGKQLAYMFRVKCTGTIGNAGAAGCIIDAKNLYVLKRGCVDQEPGVEKEAIVSGTPLWWGEYLISETITPGAEEMASGKICYNLNAPVWRQTIGEDAYPSMHNNHGLVSKMTDAGYASLYNAETAGTLSDNVEVYTGIVNGEWLTMTKQQNTIPAATAVVLKGSEGYYSFTPAASAPDITGANDLKGAAIDVDGEGKYILADGENGVCFYRATGTIPAGKVYLESAAEIKGFVFDDNATGINKINDNDNAEIYNLAGQRMSKVQKGINIIGGKKVLK